MCMKKAVLPNGQEFYGVDPETGLVDPIVWSRLSQSDKWKICHGVQEMHHGPPAPADAESSQPWTSFDEWHRVNEAAWREWQKAEWQDEWDSEMAALRKENNELKDLQKKSTPYKIEELVDELRKLTQKVANVEQVQGKTQHRVEAAHTKIANVADAVMKAQLFAAELNNKIARSEACSSNDGGRR